MNRTELGIQRKFFHLFGTLVILAGYEYLRYPVFAQYLFTATILFISVDFCKRYSKKLQKIGIVFFKPVIRDYEQTQLSGISYTLFGILISTSLFNHQINTLAILFLAFVDPIASFFGILYGKNHKISANASLHGCIASFLSAFFLSLLYFSVNALMLDRLLIVSILSALVATLSESLNFKIDDNFVIPVLSSVGLWGIFSLFNI
ncbi:MAG: hypothetical protein HAW63_01695 [Bdellovibrionaceae bacterium]|nr:hypothetical protein [Pseudobdellovibrionaceae bacterium]